jgi:hypothetical protein
MIDVTIRLTDVQVKALLQVAIISILEEKMEADIDKAIKEAKHGNEET